MYTQSFTSLKWITLMSITAHASKISCMRTKVYVYVFYWFKKLINVDLVVLHKLICIKMMLPLLTTTNIPSNILMYNRANYNLEAC